jgi:hypothetical protein
MYKYDSPHVWLGARISLARDEDDAGWLVAALFATMTLLDGDQVQELFEREMDADGYFDEVTDENDSTIGDL